MPLKPLVFVPGFPATELKQISRGRLIYPPSLGDLQDKTKRKEIVRLLSGTDSAPGDIEVGQPIRSVLGITKQAQSLYDILRGIGYSSEDRTLFAPVGWDWRGAIDDAKVQADLTQAITGLFQRNQRKVVVIIHSTGGLVLRALLEANPPLAEKIEQILAFGIPWAGTLKAVRFLVLGEAFGLTLFGKRLIGLSAAEVREVLSHCQAAYDLFPPDPAKTDLQGADGKNLNLFVGGNNRQIGPLVKTAWIPQDSAHDFMRQLADRANQRLGARSSALTLPGVDTPPITNVVGWGAATDTRCVLSADGEVTFQEPTKDGDGTVPMVSAAWLRGPGVRTFFLPIGVFGDSQLPDLHARIWDAPPAHELFKQVLQDTERGPFVCAAIDSDSAVDRSIPLRIRFVASDEHGEPLPEVRVRFTTFPGSPSFVFPANSVRAEVELKRTGIQAGLPGGLFHFRADVSWGAGGSGEHRQVPFLVQT